jgi:multiple sugar transport system ATP-binding protein
VPGQYPDVGAVLSRSVLQVEHFGDCSHVYLDGGDGEPLIAKLSDKNPVYVGEQLTLSLPALSCHLFDDDGFAIARTAA